MNPTRSLASLLCAAAAAILVIPPSHAQYYTAKDLGTLGGSQSDAQGINDFGLVVGESATSVGAEHAFSYSGGIMTDLGLLNGTNYSVAEAVNNAGEIVGVSGSHAFSDLGGVMTDLGGGNSYAAAINSSGEIIGDDSIGGFYEVGGVKTHFTGPGGTDVIPEGLNDSGTIVGLNVLPTGDEAFSYAGGIVTDLGYFGGANSQAVGINDSGYIVGNRYTPFGPRGFGYLGGVFSDLGTLGGQSDPRAVNAWGEVVGTSDVVAGYGIYNAFIESAGTITDLNGVTDAGGNDLATITFAQGINDEGQIVGVAINNAGENVAFLLTPTVTAPSRPLSDFEGWRLQGNFGDGNGVPDVSSSGFLLFLGMTGIALAGHFSKRRPSA